MRNKRYLINEQQMIRLCSYRGNSINDYVKFSKKNYRVRLKKDELFILNNENIDKKVYKAKIKEQYFPSDEELSQEIDSNIEKTQSEKFADRLVELMSEKELQTLLDHKENSSPIELVKIEIPKSSKERNVGILLMSDWHADEVVRSSTVLGKNEFNKDIAENRIKTFFANSVKMIKKRPTNELIIGCLGDLIGGWIHDELAQTNSMTPMEGSSMIKSLIVSGLKLIYDSFPEFDRITFIGICGNHSRTTKKMQFANGYALSYEYFMYKDIEQTCCLLGMDKIKFDIPQSEFAYIECMGRRLLFAHGHQFKYAGGIGGIYPSMLRWYSKLNQTIDIDKVFMGHWHTSINTKEAVVNGSLKGYDAYAMGKGLPFETPQQTYLVLNEKRGFILYTPIFCD